MWSATFPANSPKTRSGRWSCWTNPGSRLFAFAWSRRHWKTSALGRSIRTLIRARNAPHREFDVAAGQLAPAFDRAHIGRPRITVEEVARPRPRAVARQREGLAQIAVVRLAPGGHPAGEIAWTQDHVATPVQMTTGQYRAGGERFRGRRDRP